MEILWRNCSNIILLGDFNVNLSSSCDLSLKRKFTRLLCKFNLKNVIDVPTRLTGDTSSLIDLIITSVPSKFSSHGAYNPGISVHHLVYAAVNLWRISEKPKLKLVRDFKRVDIKALNLNLRLLHGLSVISVMILTTLFGHRMPYISTSSTNIFLLERLKLDQIVCPGWLRPWEKSWIRDIIFSLKPKKHQEDLLSGWLTRNKETTVLNC